MMRVGKLADAVGHGAGGDGVADQDLIAALEELWRAPPPEPHWLLSTPAFLRLHDLCKARYGDGGSLKFALSTALRSLGMPCDLSAAQVAGAPDPAAVAEALDAAFRARHVVRRHLCPLDLADHLPELVFGGCRVSRFSAGELAGLFDALRLARNHPTWPLDAKRLARFQWLVVEETVDVDPRPGARKLPWLFKHMGRDFNEIVPHHGRFPAAVETAVAFLLLAPWEEWSALEQGGWRGFRIPWIHTVTDDLFVSPDLPPNPDTLSFEPWIHRDDEGNDIEEDRPSVLQLVGGAAPALERLDTAAWTRFGQATESDLLRTPVAHFLVRAFLADGMDEIMAHLTAIEAALGTEADYQKSKGDPHHGVGATRRVAARVAALLNDARAARIYRDLFDVRSAFIHGRTGVRNVSGQSRKAARSLARRVAEALVTLAVGTQDPREDVLTGLLDRGVPLL